MQSATAVQTIPIQTLPAVDHQDMIILVLPGTRQIQRAIELFLDSHDVRDQSISTYRRSLKPFQQWIESQPPTKYDHLKILQYRKHLESKGLKPRTIGGYLTPVRQLFSWCEAMGMFANIAKQVKNPKQKRTFQKKRLQLDQITDLLESIPGDQLRDYAILNLMFRTGLRAIEVIRANIGDIREEGDAVLLDVWGKGRDGRDDFVVLTEKALAPIRAYLATRTNRGDDQPLFASMGNRNSGGRMSTRTVSRIFKERLRAIGIDDPKITAHSTRHSTATIAFQSGASLPHVQKMMRHVSIETTMIYVKMEDRITNAAEKLLDAAF